MWTSRSKLRNELIESLKRENAALRALLSASGIAFPDLPSTPSPQPSRRPVKKMTGDSVYRATRESRLGDQLRKQEERELDENPPASPDPSANSNA